MNIPFNSRIAWATVVLLWSFVLSDVQAQQFMIQGNDQNAAMQQQFKMQIEAKRNGAVSRLQTRIADIHRAAELTEEQLKKLEIAAKGAVKAYMKKATKVIVDQAKAMGFEFDPDAEPKEDDENADDQPADLLGAPVMAMNWMGQFPGSVSTTVEKEKRWTTSVEKVLSEEQSEKFEKLVAERIAFRRQSAVNHFISRVDQKLLLSAKQRKELGSMIDEKYGSELARKIEQPNNMFFAFGGVPQPDVDTTEVDGILSESQIELWKTGFSGELAQLEANPAMGFAVPAINVMPAIQAQVDDWVEAEETDDDKDDDDK